MSLSIDNVKAPAGSVAEVGVYATSNSSDVISGFNLPLDINDDGYTAGVLPAGFKLDPAPVQSALYGDTYHGMPQPQTTLINVDGIATGPGANVQLGSTPTLLFDLAIDVGSAVPFGTVLPLEIEVPNAPFQTQFDVAGPNSPVVSAPTSGTTVDGSITVTGVPEPSQSDLRLLTLLPLLLARPFRPSPIRPSVET